MQTAARNWPRSARAVAGRFLRRRQINHLANRHMKERPILFSASMVRAILEGRKTQTRRVCSSTKDHNFIELNGARAIFDSNRPPGRHELLLPRFGVNCPYGEPGDQLWVRETWAPHPASSMIFFYRADDENKYADDRSWRPSIHMPRRASRITLEVTGVRVERVQDISEEDAFKEGALGPQPCLVAGDISECGPPSFIHGYIEIWDSINGKKHPWASNPWVWVIGFHKL